MIIDELYARSLERAKGKAWIFSDLQQGNPDYAWECMGVSMADFEALGKPADQIWYLGDAVEGRNKDHLLAMTEMQVEAFERAGVPLCFVMGNHDLDYSIAEEHRDEPPFMPFYEAVRVHEGWHTTKDPTEWHFRVPFGDNTVYFFSDHLAADRAWVFKHGRVEGDHYPFFDRADKIRAEMANEKGNVITASHYSYFGGNRESAMMTRLFPLPEQVKMHFYGHSHLGEYKYGRENACRTVCGTDWHDVPQFDVSSFEHIRGAACRSVFLHVYEDNTYGVFFRDHDRRVFTEAYFPPEKKYTPCLAEIENLKAELQEKFSYYKR